MPSRLDTTEQDTVDVLCDGAGRLGSLAYLVPKSMAVVVGAEVKVPFGASTRRGVVLGPADEPGRATKEILEVSGQRIPEEELAFAQELAAYYCADFPQIAARLKPRAAASGAVCEVADPDLVAAALNIDTGDRARRYLLRAPLLSAAKIAADEAYNLTHTTSKQVLILCPTVALVTAVLAEFRDGAVRLDGKTDRGEWAAFCEGRARIGVGTRAAALYGGHDLGTILVVEEDHPGHGEMRQPATNARDIAIQRSRALGYGLVLIGANPTPAGLGGGVKVVNLEAPWPTIKLVQKGEHGRERLVPSSLLAQVSRIARRGQQPVVVFSKSHVTRVCAQCRTERECSSCGDVVGDCRHKEVFPCPQCGTTRVSVVGWDAPRVEGLFGARVRAVEIGEVEAIREAGAVVLFDADRLLRAPGLVPHALATHVLLACAEAAGVEGTVFVLTENPAHPVLSKLAAGDVSGVAKLTWDTAKAAGLPPFGHTVRVWVGKAAAPRLVGWPGKKFGPRRVKDEWEVLVTVSPEELELLRPCILKLKSRGKVRIKID